MEAAAVSPAADADRAAPKVTSAAAGFHCTLVSSPSGGRDVDTKAPRIPVQRGTPGARSSMARWLKCQPSIGSLPTCMPTPPRVQWARLFSPDERGVLLATAALPHEATDELRSLIGCGIKRKMTRIEDMDLGVRNVAAIGLRLREVER